MRLLSAILISGFALNAGAQEPASVRRVAFVVGANDGGKDRVRLRYAGSDAQSVADVLTRIGGVAPSDLIMLRDPSKAEFVESMDRLNDLLLAKGAIARRVELIVYYSGHSDDEGLLLKEDRYPYADFRQALESLPADVRVAVVDSCASGAMTRSKGGVWKPPFLLDESSQVSGHAILTSTADNESAQESDRLRASFFTHYFLSGLRGAADLSRDGRVTLNEAYQFAFNETLARTENSQGGAQHPAYDMALSGTGDLVLTDLRGSSAGLRLGADIEGRVFVRDLAAGRLTAELHKTSGQSVDLGLEPGKYTVTVLARDEALGARVELVAGSKTDVNRNQLISLPKELTTSRGGRSVEPVDVSGETIDAAAKPAAVPIEVAKVTTPDQDTFEIDLGIAKLRFDLGPLRAAEPARPPPTPAERTAAWLKLWEPPPGLTAEYDFTPLYVSAVPGIAFPGAAPGRKLAAHVALGFVTALDRVDGASVSFVNVVADDLWGAQVASIGNVTGGSVSGAQVGSVFGVAGGGVKGAQVSGVFNMAGGPVFGFQGAGIFNVAFAHDLENVIGLPIGAFVTPSTPTGDRLRMRLVQASGFFNFAGANLDGGQAAGVFNVADGTVRGAQLSGVFNRATGIAGAQISLLNISGDVTGAQIGLVNIAGVVKGTQIGLVNLSEDLVGVPVGLLNLSTKGIFEGMAYTSDLSRLNLGMKFGSRYFYTFVGAAMDRPQNVAHPDDWAWSWGLGARLPGEAFFADFDVIVRNDELLAPRTGQSPDVVTFTPRLQVGWHAIGRLSVVAGVGANVALCECTTATSGQGGQGRGSDTAVSATPAFLLGVQF